MLEETGEILALNDDGVLVQTIRQSACSSCSAAKGCGQKLLASVGQGQRFEVVAENPLHLPLQVGDQVVLALEETALLKASVWAYLMPLILLAAFAAVAEFIWAAESMVILFAVVGLVSGMFFTRWRVNNAPPAQYQPQIIRQIPKA